MTCGFPNLSGPRGRACRTVHVTPGPNRTDHCREWDCIAPCRSACSASTKPARARPAYRGHEGGAYPMLPRVAKRMAKTVSASHAARPEHLAGSISRDGNSEGRGFVPPAFTDIAGPL